MNQSKKSIQNKSLPALKKDLQDFLRDHRHVYCKSLKRKVFLDKLPEVITKRRDARRRLQCFFVGINLIKNSKHCLNKTKNKVHQFEIVGRSLEGKKVFVHIREETNVRNKNKQLFLISTFFQQK